MPVHVKDAVHQVETLFAIHHISTHAKALEIIEHIRFYAFQTRFRALNAVCFNPKGEILGLCQAIIALASWF